MLNTLKTNLILTRAVLIALFAGLFILAACGGGSNVKADVAGDGDDNQVTVNPCDTNPYGSTCGSSYSAARTKLFDDCQAAIAGGAARTACTNLPDNVEECTDDPFLADCAEVDFVAAGGTNTVLLSLQNTRINVCRDDGNTIDNAQCTSALATRCFATDANPNIFDTLCSKSSAERDTIIAKCAIDATVLATDADCAPALAAAGAGFSCFQNPWDADCELLPDFAGQLATARTNRVAYCADTTVANFNASLCTTATAQVCASSGTNANPFSALCTGASNTYDSVRTAFATNCFNDANNGADCSVDAFTLRVGNDALCGNGDDIMGSDSTDEMCTMRRSVTVETCADAPFSTDCRGVDTFAGVRAGLLESCTNGVDDGAEREFYCGGAGGFSNDDVTCLQNPFTPVSTTSGEEINCGTVLTALGDSTTLKTVQDNLIANCTGADADGMNTLCGDGKAGDDVAACLANPFTTGCDATLGTKTQADVARTNIRALCTTADSDNFNTHALCTGLTGNVKTCLDNPFTVAVQDGINCETDLGDTQAVMRAQANLNALCLGDSLTRNALCTPELKTSQFCSATADGANPFNVNCDAVDGIDAGARTAFCTANSANDNCTTDLNTLRATCSANPFAEACFVADSGYEDNRVRAIAACNGVSVGERATDDLCMGVEVKAAVTGENAADAVTLASCFAEPFQSACADDAFDTVKAGVRFSCGAGDQPSCDIVVGQDSAGMNVTVAMCNTDPLNSACADKSFDIRRNTRVGACLNALPSARDATTECDDEVKAMVPAEGNNPMIPAVTVKDCIDNPFSADCTNGAFDNARGTSYNNCANAVAGDPATATTNADCIRDVVAEVMDNGVTTPAVTVADCVADPFSTGCVIDGFIGARNGICQSSVDASSFNAGCTVEDYSGLAFAREVAVEFCSDPLTSADASCDTAVSSETDAPTIRACVTNPFTAGCDAELFNTAERQATYCEAGASTIFDENCDDARPEVVAERNAAVRTCLADSVAIAAGTGIVPACTTTVLEVIPAVTAIAVGDALPGPDGILGNGDDTVAVQADVRAFVAEKQITLASCVENPWLSACTSISSFDNARFAHTEVCMRGGRADNPECMNLLDDLKAGTAAQKARAVCITNPFAGTCTGTIYSSARTNRYAFCRDNAVIADAGTDGLCGGDGETTGTTIVSEICSWDGVASTTTGTGTRINPLAGVCDVSTNVADRARYCGVGGRRASETAACGDAVTDINTADGCLANPFSAECTTNAGGTITTELRTFLTTQRTNYCTDNVADEDFQVSLCQTADSDVDFASIVCEGQGEDANPFAPFCVRDGNTFDADRETFVKACADLATGTTLAGGATCTQAIIDCNTDAFGAGCADESAYASLRQSVVDLCVAAVADDSSTAAANANCVTIAGVGQLTCITENPYLNRAEAKTGDIVTTVALNCVGNSSYDMLRTTLETVTCLASGTPGDTRCGALVANVCGTGVDAAAVVGTNPFNANYCFATDNTFNTQRKALIDSCDGTSTANGCTAEINACINNPFATTVISTTGTETCQDATVVEFFADRKVAYCGLESTNDVANIGSADCQMLATTLMATNACIANPFADACTDALLGGATDAKSDAQTLRTTYCSGLGTSSATIRGDGTSAYCLGAAENFCKGDNLFATTSGADMFDCLSDTGGTYNADRATHYELCLLNSGTRTANETDCTNAMAEICTTTNGLQTNPWAPICSEGNADATVARQTVINACLDKVAGTGVGQRGEDVDTNVCTRTLGDLTANTDVAEILATCDGDPRLEVCTPFTGTAGEGYAPLRLARYVSSCAGTGAYATDALCPEQLVKDTICVASGDNARPFASICSQTGDSTEIVADTLTAHQNAVLTFCQSASNSAHSSCTAGNSAMAILDVCGAAADKNPFSDDDITGFGTGVNCAAYTALMPARTAYQTACQAGTDSAYTKELCVAAISTIVADVCNDTLSAKSNPFNTEICDTVTVPNTTAKETLAAACVGQVAGAVLAGNGDAVCIQTTRDCANRPFGTNCDDVGYNKQEAAVLTMCNTSEKILANGATRCINAIADLPCLKDPIGCTDTEAGTAFDQATIGAVAYRDALRTNRFAYCSVGDRVSTLTSICRSRDTTLSSYCIVNPFEASCTPHLYGSETVFRNNRRSYCLGLGASTIKGMDATLVAVPTSTNNRHRALPTTTETLNLCKKGDNLNDAVGEICYGHLGDASDKGRDPFSEFCQAFTGTDYMAYDDRRKARLLECANEGIGNTMTTSSVALAVGSVVSCNWAAQVTHCANTDASLNAQCGEINTTPKWVSGATTIAFTNSTSTANAFIENFDNNNGAVTFTEATLELTSGLAGRRIEDAVLPNVRFYSARTKAVRYTCEDDHVPGPDTVVCADGADGIRLGPSSVATVGAVKTTAGVPRFFAGIEMNSGNVGRPVFNRVDGGAAATWTGQIDWIGNGNAFNATGARTGFRLRVNFANRTVQGAVPVDVSATTGNHLVIDGTYNATGYISGRAYINDYGLGNPNDTVVPAIGINAVNTSTDGLLSGLIGHLGAVGVFISNDLDTANGFAGGFIVKPQ